MSKGKGNFLNAPDITLGPQSMQKAAPEVGAGLAVEEKALTPPPAQEEARPEVPPPNLFSGTRLKLTLYGKNGDWREPVPGHKTRWFDDIKGERRIEHAIASGWKFVMEDEIAMYDLPDRSGNNDNGGKVRTWVGQGRGNEPGWAYALKIPIWLWEQHQYGEQSYERRHREIVAEIMSGTHDMQAGDKRYSKENAGQYGSISNLPPIRFS